MAESIDEQSDMPEGPIGRSMRFRYIKGSWFRTIHVDGAYGGFTGRGNIWAAVYSERGNIPKTTTATVLSAEKLSQEQPDEPSGDQVRDVEAVLLMDINAARSLRDWLSSRIDILANLVKADREQNAPDPASDPQ